MIFFLLLALVMKSMFIEIMNQAADEMDEKARVALQSLLENFELTISIYIGAYALSIISVVMMFKLKKIGFYIYAPLHIIMTFYPYTQQPFELDGGLIFNILILGAFLIFYGVNLKHMK